LTRFFKYEGLGNDLVFFSGQVEEVLGTITDRPAWIAALCDRHRGVGGDGVMFVSPRPGSAVLAHISYFNADGSPAEMCGNGLRCACLFLHHQGLVKVAEQFTVQMALAGERRCTIHDVQGNAGTAEVEIGTPVRGAGARNNPQRLTLTVDGTTLDLVPLSVSNPHAVTFDPLTREQMEVLGPALETDEHFPGRVNVEFASVAEDGSIDLVVWERGCGFTQACGSGACATAVASIWEGHSDRTRPVVLRLPGGQLIVRIDDDDVIWLSGHARLAFEGTLDIANF
jgi:diaminopimelate epimerase